MLTLVKHQDPQEVIFIDNAFSFEVKVLLGDPYKIFKMLSDFCNRNNIPNEHKITTFLIGRLPDRKISSEIYEFLKANDINVVIPPMEMSA